MSGPARCEVCAGELTGTDQQCPRHTDRDRLTAICRTLGPGAGWRVTASGRAAAREAARTGSGNAGGTDTPPAGSPAALRP